MLPSCKKKGCIEHTVGVGDRADLEAFLDALKATRLDLLLLDFILSGVTQLKPFMTLDLVRITPHVNLAGFGGHRPRLTVSA